MRRPVDPAERKRRKRIYNRQKQQIYRQNTLDEIRALQALVPELEAQLHALQQQQPPSTCLPWRDVALALHDGTQTSHADNSELIAKKSTNRTLLRAMVTWVATQRGLAATPRCTTPSWRHVTLLAAPDARKLGVDWITQHVLHNTDRILAQYGLPSTADVPGVLHLEGIQDECMQYTIVDQKTYPASLSAHAAFVRAKLASWLHGNLVGHRDALDLLDTNLVHEVDPRLLYIHSQSVAQGSSHYMLFRECHVSESRIVFVGQNIHDDEALPKQALTCNRTFWVVLDRCDDGRVTQRMVLQRSQHYTKDGFVSLDEEAHLWGCDLRHCTTDDEKAARFQSELTALQTKMHRLAWVHLIASP
ncbi:hypothetical protein SPRG_10567 [Saprolegnia parasitica CBS 223.65]|uniref:BZIP domain-containing protein n=1 Tax=Saprolegnia parasitica (strain CBS 223.65) TaxID=695850 RepID=A0A067C4T7_SAPPC|nr:hypothetical protein SPRG_10567 [Saprolegnia parasitica CBS 223.65]KDO24140.1 hypothetical protein SPRG_10567 [Saprolegnia parasitica CBS 223.65]|eukprot:XP_012205084.1 hypothetical protein SPRG_10567 [Saprolegnia parasitica CBS 223.65]